MAKRKVRRAQYGPLQLLPLTAKVERGPTSVGVTSTWPWGFSSAYMAPLFLPPGATIDQVLDRIVELVQDR